MPELTRRSFMALAAAAGVGRVLVPQAVRVGPRRVLTLVRDRATGGLRAVDRLVR